MVAGIFIRKSNTFIENSSFSKNLAARGGAIYIGTIEGKSPINYTINNCTFDQNGVNESKGGAIYSWADELNITNSNFTKNKAMTGGAILFEKGPNFLENCTFDGNKATRYGGGAISSTRHGEIINNCTFRNNDAQGYGGAVSLDYPVITNSLFVNNSANHGGAICTITANVSNSEFYNNTAIDHWVVLAATKLIEYNNTHPGQVALSMNHTNYVNIEYDQDKEIGYAPGYYVYCVEEWADYPQYGVMWEDLRYAQSSLTEEAVGQYLKILIYKYWVNESGHDNFQKLINIFSDEDFRKSDNEIVKDVIALYDSGYRVPSNNAIKVDDNGTVIVYNFREIITPSATQNVFAFNLSYNPNATVVKELVNKSDIFINSTVDFNITVKNNCDFNLTYLIINETDFSEGLIYKSFKSDFNWTYDNVTKVWTLEDDLAPNKTANIILTFNVTKNGKMNNTVSLLIGNYTLDNSTVNFTVYAPNLTVKKLALNKTVYIGNQTVFTIIVENTGDYNLTNVTVVEKIPTGLKFASFKGDGWTTTDNVTFKYQKTLNVDGKATLNITFDAIEAGNWTNVVTASSNVTGNRTAENTTTVYRPDLKVDKIALNKTVYLGNQTVFTIVVTNTGDCDLGNVSVVENIPVGLKYSSFVGDGWSTLDNMTFTYANVLKANKSVSFDIVFDTLAAGNWTNVVTVSSNVTGNRTAENNTTVYRPDLKVDKIALNKTVYLGNQTVFTIVVTNTGDCDLGNVSVVENIPVGLKYSSFVGDGWSTVDNVTFVYDGVLKANESASFDIVFDALAAGNWTNIVTASSNVTGNRTAENTTTVYRPDLKVEKIALNKTVYLGNQTVFTIVVTNTGDCDLGNVSVVENIPVGLKYSSFVGDGWSTVDNVTFVYSGVLKANESASFDIVFDALAAGNWTNIVTASSNVTGNRTAENTTTVYRPDLKVDKIALNKTVYLGNQTVFTIVVTNTGDCDLGNVSVVENIPVGLKYSSFVGDGWSTVDNVTFVYSGVLKANESASFDIVFDALAAGNWTNIVTASSNVTENRTAENNTTVYRPDLKVEKITLNKIVYLGNQTVFTIVVTNTGDCDLGNVSVVENIPVGLKYSSFVGDGWSTVDNVTFVYSGVLKANESASFDIVFDTLAAGNWTNIVTASSNVTGNRTAENNTTVYRPDLKVEKIALNKTVYLGNQTIFTIVVTNTGDCELGNIEVTEEIPNGLKYNDYYGNNWEKVDDYKFKYGDVLKVGESVIINIIFDTVEAGNWTNIVSASSNLTKDKTANNTTSVYSPDMTVVKLANNDVVYMGNQTSFTIIVKNTGNCKLGDIYVDEIMPEGLVYDSYVGKNWSKVENRFIYNGDLNPGEEISFTVFFNTTRSGNFTNVVTASSNLTKDKKANNTTRVYTPNMVVSKIALNPIVYTGDKTSFMITVRNTGDCDLSNIEVVESIPEGLIYDSFTGNGWIKEANKFIYNGILKPGETKDFVITFNTIKSGNFTNIVAVSSNLIKYKMSNNTTTVYTPSLKVEKITLNECVYVGNQTSFSIIVTNTGDCKLGDVFVFESSFDGLVYDSYYGDGWIKEGNKFIYMYDLDVGESAGFIIVFNTTKSGNFTNIVIAGSNLTGNITTQNNTEVIQNHTENKTIINNTTDKKTFIKQDIGLATGNPFLILLIALLTCVIPFRKQKK